MNKVALFFLILASNAFSQQQLDAVPSGAFAISADAYVGADGFGFHYLIKDNIFIKTNGVTSLEFRKNALGKIARADIENPLLIVLFYESFNTAVLIDNQLNEVKQIDFSTLGLSGADPAKQKPVVAHALGMASQNRLWVYDALSQRIGLFDYLKNTWQPISTPLKEAPVYYQSDFNYFQWIDQKFVWYACDVFGKIQTLGATVTSDGIRFQSGTSFFYTKDGKLYLRDLKNNTLYNISGIEPELKNFYYKDQNLAIFTGSGITNYKITIP